MQGRSNTLWYVVIGVLVVGLVAVVAFVVWPRDQDPGPPEISVPVSTPPTSTHPPDPGPDPSVDPGPSESLDPDMFGGHPPAQILEPLFEQWAEVPLPEQVGEYVLDPETVQVGVASTSGGYVGPDGRRPYFVVHTGFGSYKALMDNVTNHREVGFMVCGDSESVVRCAAASDDADITVGPTPDLMSADVFTDAELQDMMTSFVEWYRAQS